MTEPFDGCPTLEEIAALAEGRLRGAERERVVEHAAICDACREVLAATLGTVELAGLGTTAAGTAVELRPRERQRRLWRSASVAAAVGVALIGTILVYDVNARRTPPSRSQWLDSGPPASALLPNLWGGIVTRGGGDERDGSRSAAQLGGLLVDLHVALLAGDSEQSGELARRMAAVLADEAFLEDEAATLLEAAGKPDAERLAALRRELPGVERGLREAYEPFYLDLAAFAEEVHLAALAGNDRFLASRRAQRYLEWSGSQEEYPLPAEVREDLAALRSSQLSLEDQSTHALDILDTLAR